MDVDSNMLIWAGLGALAVLLLQRLGIKLPVQGRAAAPAVMAPAAPPVPAPQVVYMQMPAAAALPAVDPEGLPVHETSVSIPYRVRIIPQPPVPPGQGTP